ncbi:DMT family transporter, partial [Nonomuraea lactucae]|uniref:DMT family transporter n=1 Tax=Nonomuraea lactucae TaxID=2249762 RepID=UPI001F053A05
RPAPRLLAGAGVVVAGATLATGLGSGTLPGLLWALGALAGEISFSLLAIPLLPKLGALRVSAYSTVLAVPMLAAIGLAMEGTGMLRVPTPAEAAGFGYLTVVVTVVAFFLWYTSLPRLGPGRAGLFAGLIPVGAIVTGLVLGIATPSAYDLVGAGLVISGIAVGLTAGRVTPPRGSGPARAWAYSLGDRKDGHGRVRLHRPTSAGCRRDHISADHIGGGAEGRGGGPHVPGGRTRGAAPAHRDGHP